MPDIEIYSKDWCPYCKKAKALFASKGLAYTEIDITSDLALQEQMVARSGRRTVPQIFVGGEPVWSGRRQPASLVRPATTAMK